ncbi:hypothetical protein [Vibrio hangzhouensis]|uniref:Uncharacterized protein n=1 Tax=Vibrio hangzhouensis TaxID=462991 RepID=A0A1H5Y6E9_9VIBR|nr:hypothetical protein [Vibrio hangzhouensis]SEG19257.1 hypothetical protein SAMN04488244_108148 [Vibrio hangzhouensis]
MKKLKSQYRYMTTKEIRGVIWRDYVAIRSGTHKHFSTKQEKSFYFLHQIECKGYPIKLRAARGKALADPWDDYASTVYKTVKSWKHNSRRQKQYYK